MLNYHSPENMVRKQSEPLASVTKKHVHFVHMNFYTNRPLPTAEEMDLNGAKWTICSKEKLIFVLKHETIRDVENDTTFRRQHSDVSFFSKHSK